MKEIAIVVLVAFIGLLCFGLKPAMEKSFLQIEEQRYKDREAFEIAKAKAGKERLEAESK